MPVSSPSMASSSATNDAPIRSMSSRSPPFAAAAPVSASRRFAERVEPSMDEPAAPLHHSAQGVAEDVEQLQMSTLSFQDYVRERMLRRRRAEMQAEAAMAERLRRRPADAARAAVDQNPLHALSRAVTANVPLSSETVRQDQAKAVPGTEESVLPGATAPQGRIPASQPEIPGS